MASKEEVAAWQHRLDETFAYDDIIGGRLLPTVMAIEERCGAEYVSRFHGHRVLTDSFLDFFAMTLSSAAGVVSKHSWPSDMQNYPVCLSSFLTLFRTFRACEILATRGYAIDAYAHLRNAKEQVIALAAVANGISSFSALLGYKGIPKDQELTDAEMTRLFGNRLREEGRMKAQLTGEQSGLSAGDIEELKRWERMFNFQVHGSRWSFYMEAGRWMFERSHPFSLAPLPRDDTFALYMNRCTEIHWMALRMLPFLQRHDHPFDENWRQQWSILDESMRFMELSLHELGKKIASAIANLIDAKFNFSPDTRYLEPA